jgi:hypothetical protein
LAISTEGEKEPFSPFAVFWVPGVSWHSWLIWHTAFCVDLKEGVQYLVRLARAAGIELDQEQTQALVTITAFNIEARYPDLKRSFRAKCTPDFTERQMELIKETITWLRSMISARKA